MENKDELEILFIRHAKTDYKDIGDRDNCDGDLTDEGEKQCIELGERLKDVEIDAYISSSLLRAFKTATGVCNAKSDKPVIEICPEIIECGCSEGYYGCSQDYLSRYYDNTKMCESLYQTKNYSFACSTPDENRIRAENVLSYIKSRFTYGQRVAVFSHHGMLEYLIREAIGAKNASFSIPLENTSVTAVAYSIDGHCTLKYINNL